MPGKRPHGNRIRAWGLSASRSAPILHRISSLDGVRATGERSSLHTGLHIQPGEPGTLYSGAFLRGAPRRNVSFPPRLFFIFVFNQLFCIQKTREERQRRAAVMDIMIAVQDACVSGHWLTAILLSLCCFLPSCLPAGQTVDYSSVESVVSRQGDTAVLR